MLTAFLPPVLIDTIAIDFVFETDFLPPASGSAVHIIIQSLKMTLVCFGCQIWNVSGQLLNSIEIQVLDVIKFLYDR